MPSWAAARSPEHHGEGGREKGKGGKSALITDLTRPPEWSPPAAPMPTEHPFSRNLWKGHLQRHTDISLASVVPARTGKEISAFRFHHTSFPFTVSTGSPCPLNASQASLILAVSFPHWEQEVRLPPLPPPARGAVNGMQSGNVLHVAIQQAGERSDILTMSGVISSQIESEAPESVTTKPIAP